MAVARERSERALPDPGPAARLRRVLIHRRRCGAPWSDAMFDDAVVRLTARLYEDDRDAWRAILRGQRSAWRAAYERLPGPPILTLVSLIVND
jgi:hypothetical protein